MAASLDTYTKSVIEWATAVIRRLTELGIPKDEIKKFFISEELTDAARVFRSKLESVKNPQKVNREMNGNYYTNIHRSNQIAIYS